MNPDPDRGTAPASTAVLRAIVEEATGEPICTDDGGDRAGETETTEATTDDRPTELLGRNEAVSPMQRLLALFDSASSLVCVVPRIDSELVGLLTSNLAGSNGDAAQDEPSPVEARIVLTGTARERVTTPSGRVAMEALDANDGIELLVHEGDSPLGLLLVDERAVVGLFDDAGLSALLITADHTIREWVASTIQRYLSAATEP